MVTERAQLPQLGLGLGLRSKHLGYILEKQPPVGFFELLSENYLDGAARSNRIVSEISERYQVVLHGVSLSIGSSDPLNFEYLKRLKKLADQLRAPWISDHVCWTGVLGRNTHDLLPIPYTQEALTHMAERVRVVSDFLERPLLLENPSSYVSFAYSSMSEAEFMRGLVELSGCGILLDINNIYVSAKNHSFDPVEYIEKLPLESVVQVHLAGHTNKGTHILDTHSDHVIDEVWDLFAHLVAKTGPVSTMVEWDENIPAFEVVFAEVRKAHKFFTKRGTFLHA
ncbi:MAG: DUF692 domain-containing protein [Myxococcales bacterium]|nr:DUF692 domain-containing protein [Myxococcales bacterium]